MSKFIELTAAILAAGVLLYSLFIIDGPDAVAMGLNSSILGMILVLARRIA